MKKEYAEKKKAFNKKMIKDFESDNLIINTKKELDKKHIKDDKEKLFVFFGLVSGLSGLKNPKYRLSIAILGDSSVGKDNIFETAKEHIPEKYLLDVTRITGASIEDDIKEKSIIYIGEGNFQREDGSNKAIIEYIKSLAERGTHVIKKDVRKGRQGEKREEKQDRKTIIYSTTDTASDDELSTRFAVVSIRGYQSKTKKVNQNTLNISADFEKEVEYMFSSKAPSWIKLGLEQLDDFDIITIPYADILDINSSDPRSQRDLKRFLNLVRAIAWYCQKQRVSINKYGIKILVASPEDFYNAIQIGEEIFAQSFAGVEKRLEDTVEVIDSMDQSKKVSLDDEFFWIPKVEIQHSLNIKTRDTINKRLKRLADLGLIEWKSHGNQSYVRLRDDRAFNEAFKDRLITVQLSEILDKIKIKYKDFIKNRTLNERLLNGTNYKKTVCLDFKPISAFNSVQERVCTDIDATDTPTQTEIERSQLNAQTSTEVELVNNPMGDKK